MPARAALRSGGRGDASSRDGRSVVRRRCRGLVVRSWSPPSPVALAAGLLVAGCDRDPSTQAIVAAAGRCEPPRRLQITYPLEGTLFPPESVAPTFVWEDKTGRRRSLVRRGARRHRRRRAAGFGRRAALETVGGELEADQAAERGARRRGDRRRRQPHEARDHPVVGARAHSHVEGPGRRFAVLSRGAAAVPDGRAGSIPHPLALRHHRHGVRPADRAAEPARVRQLPLLRGQRQRARARRRLRQRQGRLRHHAGVEAHGDGRREDHHLGGLQARGRRAHLRVVVAGLADGTVRDQHGQGPVRVRRHPGPHDLAALLPHQRHSRRLRSGDEDVCGVAGGRRPAVRADQRGVEPRRQGDRVRQGEGLPRGAPRPAEQRPGRREGRPGVHRREEALSLRPVPDPVQRREGRHAGAARRAPRTTG